MEFSSPLAAMGPPALHSWGGSRDLPSSRLMYSTTSTGGFGTNNFNFRDLSMQRVTGDYFSARPTRGSSPTASLAADLSSNFHIDQSPAIPTPRRSLFARNLLLPNDARDHLTTPPVDYDGATTPPIPSSSPAVDIMDVSPLPHKAPCFVARITLPSPSPEETPVGEDVETPMVVQTSVDLPMLSPAPLVPTQMVLPERRKPFVQRPTLQRPPLLRPRTFGPYSAPPIPSKEALLPPFQFGTSAPVLTSASTPNLLADMIDSPMEASKSFSALLAAGPPAWATATKTDGSPVGAVRRSMQVPHRPRKQVRRSLSMFQHPEDVMKDRERYEPPMACLQPDHEMDLDYKHKLPHTLADEPDSLPRIQQDTLINVLNGQYTAHYDKVLVVDCRFEYEYEGGHIDGAVNYNDKDLLAGELFGVSPPPRTLLIFHCEYSVHRAPRMAKFVRNRDRAVNDFRYPKLTYPEMYVLEGGYSKFFKLNRVHCVPQNYVEMEHKDHERACEKGMGKLKQRAKLGRAQTFAFGQQMCQVEDSPTSGLAPRLTTRSYSALDANDTSPMMARHLTRRLATF